MSISSFSVKRPVTVTMFFLGITLLGLFAFAKMGVDLLPTVNMPTLMVQTKYQNATPEEVEKIVTEPLEAQIGTVPGVKKIRSVSKEGISVISVQFVWGTDMDLALISLREKLDNVRNALPDEVGRPTIIRTDPSSFPIISLALSNKSGLNKSYKIKYVDHSSPQNEINKLINLKEAGRVVFRRRLEQIDGVAQVIVTGGLEREILVEVDSKKLEQYGLTLPDVSMALKKSNRSISSGYIMKGLFRYSLRTEGEFGNIEQIKQTVVKNFKNGSVVRLENIADVKENFKEREGLTRLNGNETIGLLVYKEPDANTVSIAKEVKKKIKILNDEYPDFNLLVVTDQSEFIEAAISNVKQEVLYGGILAVIVLFFFLGSLRNIFAIAITIPSSLVLTILLMYAFDINFNIVSLGGIAVGVGMLLDNSIVVIENIVRYKEMGYKLREAALKGAAEVQMPVIAATATTIVVFLPLIFIRGIAGELFKDQSYAIFFSLVASIFAAISLIPMIVSREKFVSMNDKEKFKRGYIHLNKPEKGIIKKVFFLISFPFVLSVKSLYYILMRLGLSGSEKFNKLFQIFFRHIDKKMDRLIYHYERLLEWALDNRKTALLITLALILLTIWAGYDMKKEFIPESPQKEFIVELDYPKGTSLKGNSLLTEKFEKSILSLPEVKNLIANIGRVNEFDFLNKEQVSVNKSNLIIKIDDYDSYYKVLDKLRKIFSKVKGVNYTFKKVKTTYAQLLSPSENDIVVKVSNKDMNQAFNKANLIIEKLRNSNIEGLKEVRLGSEKGVPGYNITINRDNCAAYGLSIDEVASNIIDFVKGNSETKFSDFDKKISIRVKAVESQLNDIYKLLDKRILKNNMEVKLSNLIEIERTNSFGEIWREDQARAVYVYANVVDADLDETIKSIQKVIKELPGSPEELITVGGTNEEINDSFSSLYVALIISVLLMYMILASEFESFIFPFIIIFSVPLGLIGGILTLYLFGESISIISLMGLIILVGIADNDAVVKVEFIIRKREEGLPLREAIMEAGKDRFRPIVMNSLTVMFGLVPMMIGAGAGTQLRVSLSLAVAGGLFSATFLTLIIIPVLYTYFEKMSFKKFNKQ